MEQMEVFALRLAYLVHVYQVPPALVVNPDQTAIHFLSTGNARTYEKVGRKDVAVTGKEDKRQITPVVSSAADGTLLPLQLVFKGKTPRSLPAGTTVQAVTQLDGWRLKFTNNHWSNLKTTKEWVTEILLPYYTRVSMLNIQYPFMSFASPIQFKHCQLN
jgi:hypothetical protein